MRKKCPSCGLINFPDTLTCSRCRAELTVTASVETSATAAKSGKWRVIGRIVTFCVVCLFALAGFYLSLVASAAPLTIDQKYQVRQAIGVLKAKGFSQHAFLIENLAVLRSNDNWLNASVDKENAYAATNFPFEIMTLYPDFFNYPADDTERAAILLHEAEHLQGKNEHDAYKFVWSHRKQLGWTREVYFHSPVWRNVRKQTVDNAPELFVCNGNEFNDCTEQPTP